jgi:hypothetical protein
MALKIVLAGLLGWAAEQPKVAARTEKVRLNFMVYSRV